MGVVPAFAQLWLAENDAAGAPQALKKVQDVEEFEISPSLSVHIDVDFLRQRYALISIWPRLPMSQLEI